MNGIVLYRSRYGATKQYADWIGGALRLPVIDPERMDERLLATCDFLVIGAPVYIGEVLLKTWLCMYEDQLKHKKLFFFIVCAPSPDASKYRQIMVDNIPGAFLRPSTDIFFLPGRWILGNLSPTDDRVLREKALAEEDPAKRAALSQDSDAVRKENNADLLAAVRVFSDSIGRPV
jgi:hypothetical protein